MAPAPVTLYHIDPARNMKRFYRLDLQPDLFGNQCLIREWGRIGRPGQVRSIPYPTSDEAQVAFQKQRATKERRGYIT
ncbi:WGR domain-containing protein [Ktedonosporobacter rubrisoli]|uniref:WGR domain-containing protein n=1 Tax=Ktedonosporobacter rubrisoli TaxID=2509675 RepID=A0A4P6JJ79_KTERU|nr:WGR domain-containing protein [Ktedonosporobacter rubrisoli]QBD75167.1 WGR domain-containing protein [Ktedonosporobacter rubrisoli]